MTLRKQGRTMLVKTAPILSCKQ